ncbi:ankyrin repeat domain-containing protein [Pedobacter sp. MW01-1-1]|uniref:ankyrin repeat domain-containing protein n=1 Tax=Pedobacter sp. MW01-1-1 TaxID=3383027 RepID=UPI003FEF3FCB
MKIKLKETFQTINISQITDFESRLNIKLPEPYKEFLIEHNGGRPSLNNFKTFDGEIETDIQFFLGITNGLYDIGKNREQLKNVIPVDFIPIAIDSVGNFVLLNAISNKIYLLEHESLELFFVADGFNEFVNSLFSLKKKLNILDKSIANQDINYFKLIKNQGIDLNCVRNEFDQSLVIIASLMNKFLLLKFFIEIEGLGFDGALFCACSNGHLIITKYLLSKGANPNEKDEQNNTALMQASYGGYFDIVKLLISVGANLYDKDNFGQTALTKAYWSDNQELIDYFEKEVYWSQD